MSTPPAQMPADDTATETVTAVMLRARIADAAIEAVRSGDTLTPDYSAIAAIAGVDADVVRQQFPTWASLASVAMVRWHETRTMPLLEADTSAVTFIRSVVEVNDSDPRLMRLMFSTLATSSDPSDPAASFYRHQYETFYRTIRDLLVRDIEAGREPATMEPTRGAEQLLALYEGLQLQSMLRDRVDTVAAFTRAASRLRHGWTQAYRAEHTTGTFPGVYDL